MSQGKRCDIFPNSRGPAHEYVLRFVRIIPGAESPHATEEVMFTVTRDMGKRALDRALGGMEVATSPPVARDKDADPKPKTKDLPGQTILENPIAPA